MMQLAWTGVALDNSSKERRWSKTWRPKKVVLLLGKITSKISIFCMKLLWIAKNNLCMTMRTHRRIHIMLAKVLIVWGLLFQMHVVASTNFYPHWSMSRNIQPGKSFHLISDSTFSFYSLKIETITCNKLSHCLFDFDCPNFDQYQNEKY